VSQVRIFVEVDGEQINKQFPDLASTLLAHIELALERGGRVVSLHREVVEDETTPAGTHKKGDGCHCKPLSFHVSAPRRIVLASEIGR